MKNGLRRKREIEAETGVNMELRSSDHGVWSIIMSGSSAEVLLVTTFSLPKPVFRLHLAYFLSCR
jgi:hypothetical protein